MRVCTRELNTDDAIRVGYLFRLLTVFGAVKREKVEAMRVCTRELNTDDAIRAPNTVKGRHFCRPFFLFDSFRILSYRPRKSSKVVSVN